MNDPSEFQQKACKLWVFTLLLAAFAYEIGSFVIAGASLLISLIIGYYLSIRIK